MLEEKTVVSPMAGLEEKESNNWEEILSSKNSEIAQSEIELDIKNSDTIQVILDSENTQIESDAIQVSGQKVTIKKSWNYEFTGTLSDGQIIVETQDEKAVQIILNTVNITSLQGSPIVVENANQTIITLADNSVNTIEDSVEYTLDNDGPSAAISSKDDLIMRGEWVLNVIANYNDGISSNDDIFILWWEINITAIDDGIRGKNLLSISWWDIDIISWEDGLKSNNEESGTIEISGWNITISAWDDGVSATMKIVIHGGTLNVTKSYEGLEAESITINGWDTYLTSSDDWINVVSFLDTEAWREAADDIFLTINGGNLTLNSNGDGLDSNGNIIMTWGNVIVYGPTEDNNGALDFNGNFEISGGTLIAIGSSGMAEAPSPGSSQNSVLIWLGDSYDSWDNIIIKNSLEEELFNITAEKLFQAIVISSADIISGESYALEINGELIQEFDISDIITTIWEFSRNRR
jgi:hypothetical protein